MWEVIRPGVIPQVYAHVGMCMEETSISHQDQHVQPTFEEARVYYSHGSIPAPSKSSSIGILMGDYGVTATMDADLLLPVPFKVTILDILYRGTPLQGGDLEELLINRKRKRMA